MTDKSPEAPVEMQAIVYVTDGKQTGKITLTFGSGVIPTRERVKERLAKFEKEELSTLIDGHFKLMTAPEFFKTVLHEKYGINESVATLAAYRQFSDD